MSDAWSHKVRLKKIMKGRHFLCVVQRHGETTVTPGHMSRRGMFAANKTSAIKS